MKNGPAYVLFFKKAGDIFFKKISHEWLRQYLAIIFFGIFLYLIGLIIASIFELFYVFINSWIAILAIAGIIWVSSVLCYAFDNYEPVLREIRPGFEVSDEEYDQMMGKQLKTVYNNRKWIFWSLIGIIPFDIIACSGIYFYSGTNPMLQNVHLLFSCPLYFAYSIFIISLCIFLVCCGAFLLTSCSLFIRTISKYPVKIRIIGSSPTELYKLANFSLISSLTWFVGVSLVAIATVTAISPFTITFLVIVTLIGFLTFLIPQWYVHKSIKGGKEGMLKELGEKFEQEYKEIDKGQNKMMNVLALCTLFEEIKKIDEWAFGKGEVSKLILYSVLPSLATFIAAFIKL